MKSSVNLQMGIQKNWGGRVCETFPVKPGATGTTDPSSQTLTYSIRRTWTFLKKSNFPRKRKFGKSKDTDSARNLQSILHVLFYYFTVPRHGASTNFEIFPHGDWFRLCVWETGWGGGGGGVKVKQGRRGNCRKEGNSWWWLWWWWLWFGCPCGG